MGTQALGMYWGMGLDFDRFAIRDDIDIFRAVGGRYENGKREVEYIRIERTQRERYSVFAVGIRDLDFHVIELVDISSHVAHCSHPVYGAIILEVLEALTDFLGREWRVSCALIYFVEEEVGPSALSASILEYCLEALGCSAIENATECVRAYIGKIDRNRIVEAHIYTSVAVASYDIIVGNQLYILRRDTERVSYGDALIIATYDLLDSSARVVKFVLGIYIGQLTEVRVRDGMRTYFVALSCCGLYIVVITTQPVDDREEGTLHIKLVEHRDYDRELVRAVIIESVADSCCSTLRPFTNGYVLGG